MKPTRINIPDELKSDIPHTAFGKILSATPVVMAVVATMLAGLASSEMTKAQYQRSLGAQQQSKAGDQWSFFQAKRMRSALQNNTADLLQSIADVRALDAATFPGQLESLSLSGDSKQKAAAVAQSDSGKQALTLLSKGELPAYPGAVELSAEIKAAMEGVENSVPDDEMERLIRKVDDRSLEKALSDAREQTKRFDAATKPINQSIDQLNSALGLARPSTESTVASGGGAPLLRHFTAARLRYAALRYEAEARLNQTIANLYELQVRRSNLEAEHHRKRSQRFFFGMLAAQAGVIISTFAMAARNRNFLWSLAAGAGLIAVAFAIYVYLYI